MVFLDKYNLPVVGIGGRWFLNIIRRLLLTRKIMRGRWDGHKVVRD